MERKKEEGSIKGLGSGCRKHGAVRAAADMRDLLGSLQESETTAMPAQLLYGAVHGRTRRLRASTGQVSRMPGRTSYTLSGELTRS